MKVKQIYQDYLCPRNLQEHMMRVAAVAKIIGDTWQGSPIDNTAVIQACLFHDIAKPMNFNLAKQAQFGMTPSDIDNLSKLQQRIKDQFSDNEHEAAVKICQAIGLSEKAVSIVNTIEWSYIPRLLQINQVEPLIAIYCDIRIGPKGILSLQERLNDLKARDYQEDFESHAKNGQALEELISSNTAIDITTIQDHQLNNMFNEFLNSEI